MSTERSNWQKLVVSTRNPLARIHAGRRRRPLRVTCILAARTVTRRRGKSSPATLCHPSAENAVERAERSPRFIAHECELTRSRQSGETAEACRDTIMVRRRSARYHVPGQIFVLEVLRIIEEPAAAAWRMS